MAGRAKLRQAYDLLNKRNNPPDFAFPSEKQGRKNGGKANPETGLMLKAKEAHPHWEISPHKHNGRCAILRLVLASVSLGRSSCGGVRATVAGS